MSDTSGTGTGRDPAETEPTDNSSGATPDPARVAEAEQRAAEREAEVAEGAAGAGRGPAAGGPAGRQPAGGEA